MPLEVQIIKAALTVIDYSDKIMHVKLNMIKSPTVLTYSAESDFYSKWIYKNNYSSKI